MPHLNVDPVVAAAGLMSALQVSTRVCMCVCVWGGGGVSTISMVASCVVLCDLTSTTICLHSEAAPTRLHPLPPLLLLLPLLLPRRRW